MKKMNRNQGMWTLGNMSTFNKTMTYIHVTSIDVIRIFDIFQMTEVDARNFS